MLVLLILRDGAFQSVTVKGKGATRASYLSSPTSLRCREAGEQPGSVYLVSTGLMQEIRGVFDAQIVGTIRSDLP